MRDYFALLLALIAGLIITKLDYIVIGLALLVLLIIRLVKTKNINAKGSVIVISIFCLGVFLRFLPKILSLIQYASITGIVIKKGSSYVIIRTLTEKIYCYTTELKLFDVVRIEGTLSELSFSSYESSFDYQNYLNNQNVFRIITASNIEVLWDFPLNFEANLTSVNKIFTSEEALAIFNAMILGETDSVSSISDKLMIAHLFSSTGLFLNFILYGIAKLFGYFLDTKHARIFSLLLCTPFFIFNIYRFTFIRVFLFFTLNIIFYRKIAYEDKFNFKCLVYFILLLVSSSLVYRASFFLPLLVMIVMQFSKAMLNRGNRYIQAVKRRVLIATTFLPYTISVYNGFNILNMLFSYTFTFLFKIIFVFCFVGFYGIKLPFTNAIFVGFYKVLDAIDFSIFTINIPALNPFFLCFYYLTLQIFVYFHEFRILFISKNVALSAILLLGIYILPIENTFTFQVTYINVGQGDSTLIRYRNKAYLIDTGGLTSYDLATNSLIPFLKSNRIYSLEAVFITHYDYDHYGALESLTENFKVKNIVDYNSVFPYVSGNLTFENLNPYIYDTSQDENDRSLVLHLSVADNSFLFMGDATTTVEEEIINNYTLDVDYLKLGHHGSSSSSSLAFLQYINPEVAIISCGLNNRYGHPSEDVISRLNQLGITYRRTDLEGSITYKFLA